MSIDLGRRVAKHNYADLFEAYSGVTLTIPNGQSFTAGDDSGRIIKADCPWASQQMANNLLAQVKGLQHQPYTATGAILDPAAELGDAVTIDGIKSIIFRRDQRFGTLFRADISAPGDEEINHEIPYYPPIQRVMNRIGGVARGAASAAATSLARQDGIEEDFTELTAKVTDLAAGMEAYVLNETFENYKISVARLFAEVDDENKEIKSELLLHASSIDGLQSAAADLTTRVETAEVTLSQKAESSTVTALDGRVTKAEQAQANLNARVGDAEASLTLKANSTTVTALDGKISTLNQSVATLEADVINLKGRVDVTGSISVANGTIEAERAIIGKANIRANGGLSSTSLALDTENFTIAGNPYTPKTITTVTAFTQALGGQTKVTVCTVLAGVVKIPTAIDTLPGETVLFVA